jgi:hypothetical protein
MKVLRTQLAYLLLLCPLLLGACKKDDVTPQTGNLGLSFKYGSDLSGTRYSLYTEQVWANGRPSATPLRDGTIPTIASGATSSTRIEIDDLNAGNYVFTVGSSNAWSVQVTAGKTTEVYK